MFEYIYSQLVCDKMAVYRWVGNIFLAAFFIGIIACSNEEGSNNSDLQSPKIIKKQPEQNTTNTTIDTDIHITFNEAMDANTINAATFNLNDASGAINGRVLYDQITTTATFIPYTALEYTTTYTVMVTTGITDLAGNALQKNESYEFTTALVPPLPWAKRFGGDWSDEIDALTTTVNGGLLAAGITKSFGDGVRGVWVVRLNGDGNIAWQKKLKSTDIIYVNAITTTTDGNVVVGGNLDSAETQSYDAWLLKLNGNGSIAWQRKLGGGEFDSITSLAPIADGGIIAVGWTRSFGPGTSAAWITKLNKDGNIVWQQTLGGSGSEGFYSVATTADGEIVASGWTFTFGAGDRDAWIVKFNNDGSIVWQQALGDNGTDCLVSLVATVDGWIAGGETGFSCSIYGGGGRAAWIVKFNNDGSIAWQKVFDEKVGGSSFSFKSLAITVDGGVAAAGSRNVLDPWVVKLNSDGSTAWQHIIRGGRVHSIQSLVAMQDGGIVAAGKTTLAIAEDAWALRFNPDGNIDINNASGLLVVSPTVQAIDSNASLLSTSVTPMESTATINNTYMIETFIADNMVSIETLTGPSGAVEAPSDLAVIAPYGTSELRLTWIDQADDETGYIIFRSEDNVTFIRRQIRRANTTSLTDTAVGFGTDYYYKVVGYNAAGYSDFSNVAMATVQ